MIRRPQRSTLSSSSAASDVYKKKIYNKGENISKEEGKELWELLYKGDMSRSRDENSSGMGLAICRQILELHNFKYGFENKEDGVEFYFIAK